MVKGSLKMMEVEMPTAGEGEVLVRVIRVGLDGTDKDIGEGLYGSAPRGSDYLIVGHESFGVVEEIGDGVASVGPGDRVVATVRRPDGCANCNAGESDFCITGNYTERGIRGAHGYLCEYYVEKEGNLVKIPDMIKAQAVMLEPLSIVEKAIMQVYRIQQRMDWWEPRSAIVFGTGVVGLLCATLLRHRGIAVTSVDRTDRHEVKDFFYKELGITHMNSKTVSGAIADKVGRADIVVELTGNPMVVKEAISSCSINGICCLLSVTGGTYTDTLDISRWNYDMVLGNRVVFGSVNSNKKHFLQGVSDMVEIEKGHQGLLPKLITNRIAALDDFVSYDVLNAKGALKTVIEVGKDG